MHPLAPIYPVLAKYGATCSPEEFQRAINLAFHNAESQVYDRIHRSMWKSLPPIFELFVRDHIADPSQSRDDLAVLDVGCGTGLASELLLGTPLGPRIASVDLLDTSTEMLKRARKRARKWKTKTASICGSIEDVDGGRKYDVILACSVLHHIPDLAEFLRRVHGLQAPSGVFLHLQDPNKDALNDPVLTRRMAEPANLTQPSPLWLSRLSPRSLARGTLRRLTGRQNDDYICQINRKLMALGIIQTAMTDEDLWKVTDIHAHEGAGISIRELSRMLDGYRLISTRSYSFFGRMYSELPSVLKRQEQSLLERKESNGLRISGLWRRLER